MFSLLIVFTFFICYIDAVLLPAFLLNGTVINQNNDNNKYSNRILGGQAADIKDHPYVVSYSISSVFCGGFIISDSYILTAAHCVKGENPSTIILLAGSSLRSNGTIIPISAVTSHPSYDIRKLNNDVGVMKTVAPIGFGDYINAIALPPLRRAMRSGSKVTVSGWGRTQVNSHLSDRLMSADIPVVSHRQCSLAYPTVLTENMFCGGKFFFSGSSVCKGDSGGVVVQNGMAVGIVSFGRGCGQMLGPNVFTHVASPSVRWFIRKHTGI